MRWKQGCSGYNCGMPLDIRRIRALCFDVDGTLSDTDDQYARRIQAWISPFSFIHNSDRVARRLVMWMESPGTAMMTLSDTIGLDSMIIPAVDWLSRNVGSSRKNFLMVPGIAEMLPRLKQRCPMAVISAREERHTLSFLDECGLTAYFDVILTALSAPHTKPYPDPVRMAARVMGVPAENCLMIGDTTVDIRAGRAAGAQTIGVLCGFGEEAELRRAGADLIVPATPDVEGLLQSAGSS